MGEKEGIRLTEKEIFTVKTLAEYLSINYRSIYNFVKEKNLPHFWVGNRLRFRKKEIEEWITGEMKKERKKKKR